MRTARIAGFTLIELMVVVAIIGILAAVGIPRLTAYLRTAETSEAVEQFGRIAKSLEGYAGTRQLTTAQIVAAIQGNNQLDQSGNNQLSDLIPQLTLSSDAMFDYVVNPGESGGELHFCLVATANANSPNEDGQVFMSSVIITDGIWENYIYRAHYTDGSGAAGPAPPAGGHCTATGTFQ